MIPNPYDLEWKVEADEEFKGSHPYHDNRFITQGDGDDAIIIARMSDMPLQKEYATLIASAPRLLKALQDVTASLAMYLFNEGGTDALRQSRTLLEAQTVIDEATLKGKKDHAKI